MIIEEDIPFRNSHLWSLQDQAYSAFGPLAWSVKGVPSYLTSHPLLAHAYSQQIRAFMLGCKTESATIIDLGAGTGRLAFHILEELSDLSVDYVLTDITEAHLDSLKIHPKLKPYFEKGQLHTYLYHHLSGEPPVPNQPTIVIANYYLDTLPQTLYRAVDGALEEGYITLQSSDSKEGIESIPGLMASYTFKPASNPLAEEYAKRIQNGIFLEPHGGLETLSYYLNNSQPLIILAADQGVASPVQIQRLKEPKIARHGTFSVTVHYDYLKFLLEKRGLQVFLPQIPDETLIFMTACNKKLDVLKRAYANTIDTIAPTDYFHLSNALEAGSPNLQQILSLIKLGAYDPINTYLFFPKLKEMAKETELKDDLAKVLMYTAKTFFPINAAEASFYNEIGALLYELNYYTEALICFQQVLNYSRPTPELLRNIAACLAKH